MKFVVFGTKLSCCWENLRKIVAFQTILIPTICRGAPARAVWLKLCKIVAFSAEPASRCRAAPQRFGHLILQICDTSFQTLNPKPQSSRALDKSSPDLRPRIGQPDFWPDWTRSASHGLPPITYSQFKALADGRRLRWTCSIKTGLRHFVALNGGYKRDKMMEKKLGFISYNKSGWLTLKFEPANTLFNTLYGGKGSGVHKFESL